MDMRTLLQRREAVRKELRQIHDANPAALAEDVQTRWTVLEAELTALDAAETRQATLDAEEKRAGGVPLTGGKLPELPEGHAYAFGNETRWGDWIARETQQPAGKPGDFGRAVRYLVTGKGDSETRVAMGESTGVGGGFTLGAPVSSTIFDLLRPSLVMGRAGCLTIPMDLPTLGLVQVVADPTSALRSENTEIPESTGTFNQITLRASSIAAKVRVSLEMIEDNPAFLSEIEHQIQESMAHQIDFLCLSGVNTGLGPTGLRNVPGQQVVSMGENGAAFTSWDNILDVMEAVEQANGNPKTLIWNPRTRYAAATLKDGAGNYLSTESRLPPEINGLQRLSSNQVAIDETQGSAGNASTCYVGEFSNCAIGMRKNITLEVTRDGDGSFRNVQVVIRAVARFDFAVIRPYALGQLNGVIPA